MFPSSTKAETEEVDESLIDRPWSFKGAVGRQRQSNKVKGLSIPVDEVIDRSGTKQPRW